MNATAALIARLKADCRRANVALDAYDIDFILGAITGFLGERDLVLTANGLRRLRR